MPKSSFLFFILVTLAVTLYAQPNTWQPVTPTDTSKPIARHEAGLVAISDQLILLGGRRIKPVSIWDAKTNQWRTGAVPPLEMHHFQPVVYKKKVYILGAMTGGYPGETPVPNVYIYDPAADSWEKGPEIPEHRRRGSAGVVLYKNKIYMVCGIKDGHRGDHKTWLDEFNPKTGQWRELPDAPRARDHFQAAVVGNTLVSVGGRLSKAPDQTFNHTIAQADAYHFKTKTWTSYQDTIPTPRAGCFVSVSGGRVWVLGGESVRQPVAHNEVEGLDVKTGHWHIMPPMLKGRHGTGAAWINGQLHVASGCGRRGGNPELDDHEVYNLKGQ